MFHLNDSRTTTRRLFLCVSSFNVLIPFDTEIPKNIQSVPKTSKILLRACYGWYLSPRPLHFAITFLLRGSVVAISQSLTRKICQQRPLQDTRYPTLHTLKRIFETFNHLNAELNPICHLLVLLEDLTFMGPWIFSIFQYISNKMQRYTVYLYLETALHVSYATHSTLRPVPTLPR